MAFPPWVHLLLIVVFSVEAHERRNSSWFVYGNSRVKLHATLHPGQRGQCYCCIGELEREVVSPIWRAIMLDEDQNLEELDGGSPSSGVDQLTRARQAPAR